MTGFSHSSGFLHNSVVVQTTVGQRTRFVTVTGGGACATAGRSSAQVTPVVSLPAAGWRRYWDADGIAVGGDIDKFYIRYLPGGPPFVPAGSAIARFPVAQLSAAGRGPAFGAVLRPPVTVLPAYTPPGGGTPIVWGAALLVTGTTGGTGGTGGTVYVYGWQSPDASVPVSRLYLARVAAARLADFSSWTFYTGGGPGAGLGAEGSAGLGAEGGAGPGPGAGQGSWVPGQANAQPVQPDGMGLPVPAGFSVIPAAGRYWLIQSGVSPGDPDITAYPGPDPWGPFDPAAGVLLYHSPDIGLDAAHDYRILYEARAEPALSTSQTLMISYNVNSVAVSAGCVSISDLTNSAPQPRFVAVPMAAFTDPAVRLSHYRVTTGPSRYPAITQRDPSQWFSGWAYQGGCPPVPGLLSVTAQTGSGTASLTWPDVGLGVRYRVYERSPPDAGYVLARTVPGPGTTLRGLRRGATYQFLVVPVNARSGTGPGREVTVTIG